MIPRQTALTEMTMPPRLCGLSKFGITPGGGVMAGVCAKSMEDIAVAILVKSKQQRGLRQY